MAKQNPQLIAFNRGVISKHALARVDLERMRYSAEEQTNWIPRVFGPMMLRPGFQYMNCTTLSNLKAVPIPFIRSTSDVAILEATNLVLRPLVNVQPISRPSVSTTVTNGTFSGNITGWTTADQTGASSAYFATNQLGLTGTGINDAITYQSISVAAGDRAKEHGVRIVITRGPVGLRIGTAAGLDDLVQETQLGTGTHSLAVTPNAAAFFVYFFNRQNRTVAVGSVAIEAAGALTLPATWTTSDLPLLRWAQSKDVMYICDGAHQQQKIERRGTHSWSIVLYQPEDGPYNLINFAPTTLTPSAASGDITIASSAPLFNSKHVGALFRFVTLGQSVSNTLGGLNQTTDTIMVTGVGDARIFYYTITGTWSGNLMLQAAPAITGPWVDVNGPMAAATHVSYKDGKDNQVIYYRAILETYTSGSVVVEMTFGGGSTNGDVRITAVSDNKNASATVLNRLGGTAATNTWYEGAWSDFRGWPTSPAIHDDRLWWFGLGRVLGSITDAYESFEDTTEGGSGPINRTIGRGPVDWVNWGLSLLRLIFGTDGTLVSARSDSLDTPLTPTNFNLKYPVTQGAARIAPVSADDDGYFVHRNLLRIYKLAFDTSNVVKLDYGAQDLTALCPEICIPGVSRIGIQRQPDSRLHAVLTDGTVVVVVHDAVEQVTACIKVETPGASGKVEDVVIVPQSGYEDAVYYIVNRTVGGAVYRLYEKWAQETECVGGTLNKQADSFVTYSGTATATLTAIAPHLAGEEVIVWGDGKDLSPGPYESEPRTEPPTWAAQKTYTVAGDGTVALGVAVSNAVIGLPYEARFKGVKLAYAAQFGSALTMRKNVDHLGIIANDIHPDGLRYGPDYDHMIRLPLVLNGAEVDRDTVISHLDDIGPEFSDMFGVDSRICLKAHAPRPCRVLGLIPHLTVNED